MAPNGQTPSSEKRKRRSGGAAPWKLILPSVTAIVVAAISIMPQFLDKCGRDSAASTPKDGSAPVAEGPARSPDARGNTRSGTAHTVTTGGPSGMRRGTTTRTSGTPPAEPSSKRCARVAVEKGPATLTESQAEEECRKTDRGQTRWTPKVEGGWTLICACLD
jgi:hypothetical protein